MSRGTRLLFAIGITVVMAAPSKAQDESTKVSPAAKVSGDIDKAILALSKDKWQWMSERKVEALEALFHEKAVFVHMGGSMSKAQELDVIKSGRIQYKKADVQDASVQVIGTTAIVLNRIRLLAVVGGNEVTNPFVVTEVYVQQDGKWLLAALSFTRTLGQ
jgi:4-carboxymuconolactone decarboxylase